MLSLKLERASNHDQDKHYPVADRKTPKDFQSRLSIVDVPAEEELIDLKGT